MSGNDPYGDRRPYRGRRARPEEPAEPDPLTGPFAGPRSDLGSALGGRRRAASGRTGDPLTDPWHAAPPPGGRHGRHAQGGADPLSDPLGGPAAPSSPESGAWPGQDTGAWPAADTGAWPAAPQASGGGPRRGRRRKPESDPGLDSGPVPAAPEDPDGHRPRGRRRRREPEEEADPLGLGAAPDEGEDDPFGRPMPRRTLDFDAVPVTRKGGRRRARREPDHTEHTEHAEHTEHEEGADGGYDDPPERQERQERPDRRERAERAGRGERRGRRSRRRGGGSGGRGRSRGGGGDRPARRGKTKVLVVGAALAVVVAGGGFAARTYLFPADYDGAGSGEVEVVIPEGASGGAIGGILEDAGVVASSRAFTNALGETGAELPPGTYRLRSEMSADAAVDLMLDPSARAETRVTIKEGMRGSEILTLVSEETAIPLEDLQAAFDDPDSLGVPDYAEKGTEGYLFPDTYTFTPDMTAQEALSMMVRRFGQVAEDPEVGLEAGAEAADMDPDEVMAVAAIVQAETGSVEDMPDISAVVHNRLEQDMELGMDSTCFYVIGEHGIALTNDQLDRCKAEDSDYATYGRKGLPAGPFVSPGEDAIEAALNPSDEDYLYFVATDPENGVTEFAETYEEFQVLKQRFQQSQQGGA